MMSLFHEVSRACSEIVTQRYSTSFASAIRLLHADLRTPIHGIYGFVRFADEIVDTFHDYDKETLLREFEEDTWKALRAGISLNPILHSLAATVRKYNIPHDLIASFLHSMKMDLQKSTYSSTQELDEYIYGSAEVVGLMCLCVFVEGNEEMYNSLKESARKLGSAFQKVNFLRDIKADYQGLARAYFPGFDFNNFTGDAKARIEEDINQDFCAALSGIRRLPLKARFGVYTAYRYYRTLFRKICRMQPEHVLRRRVRVPNAYKLMIVAQAGMQNRLNLI